MRRRRAHAELAGAVSNRLLEDLPGRGARTPGLAGGRSVDPSLLAAFRRAVGDVVASHAQPRHLRKGLLTVAVDSPVWLQELTFLKAALAAKVGAELGAPAPDVKLVLDKKLHVELPLASKATASPRPAPPPASAPPHLPPEAEADVRAVVSSLGEDAELQGAVSRAMSRWKANR